MRRLIIAIAFLTRLPMPRVAATDRDFAAAIRLYPLVGLVIGGPVALAVWAGAMVDPWLGALAGTAVWIAITGALHLDGLADVADGLGAAHGDRTRMLTAMSDPHVGSFGVCVLTLQIGAKIILLHLLVAQPVAIALVLCVARIGPLVWSRMLPPLKLEGLGAAIADAARARDAAGWLAILAGAAMLVPALLAGALLIPLFALWARARIGGATGDVHGAGIELTETGLLVALLIAGQF